MDKLPQLAPKQVTGWNAVRHYLDLAGKFTHATLACQVMAGFELKALRDTKCMQGARTDIADGGEHGWLAWCHEEANLSKDKACRLLKMAEGVKNRFANLEGQERLAALLSTPPQHWDKKELGLIHDVVKQLTDGKTQADFLRELGLHRDPDKTGGDHAWQKWCAKIHPELLKDGKAPLRGHTPKAVRREFEKYLTEQAAANIGKRAEVETKEAKDHVRRLVRDLGGKLLRNDILLCGADLLEQLEDARVELGHIIKDAKRTAK